MRGRVAAVLLLLSSLSLDSSGQCSYLPRYSGQLRATVYDVAVDGNFLWTATGYGVQLLESGEIADAVPLPGSTRVIAPRGSGSDLAYAGSGSKIIVLRRNGHSIDVVRSASVPGFINDIVVTSTHLFVATRSGIAHYDLLDPTNPVRTSATLATSRQNVTSLAISGNNLYAADGDATVEIFNVSIPAIPQKTGALDTLPRAAAVHVSEGFVYVSDEIGQNTDVFGGTSRIARVPYGSTSLVSTVSGAVFVGGGDRTLRALDVSNPARPAELFEQQLAPTGGTSNGIFDLARSGNTLYVAAGDIGLLTYDVSSLTLPYPLVSYRDTATSGAVIVEGSNPKAYFTSGSSLVETSLQLSVLRNTVMAGTVRDTRGSELLMTSGPTATLSSYDGPVTSQVSFKTDVTDAVVTSDTIIALLADQSVWTAKTTAGSTPQQLDLGGAKIAYLARSGSTYALAEIRDDGTTVIHLPSKNLTVDGAATGGLALSPTQAAIFTFRGLNLVDLSSGAVTVLPNSTNVFPKQLLFAGTDLLVLGDRTLAVWDTTRRTLTRRHTLPANAARMYASNQRAVVATDEGMLVINYLAKLPAITAEPDVNRYYTKAVTGRDRLYLFSGDGVDVYSTINVTPQFLTGIREPGLIDVAASSDAFYTLAGNGEVTAYSPAGVATARAFVDYGTDMQPLAIFSVGGAVWVTISTNCRVGQCEKWTMVLDPRTLTVAGIFAGGVTDVEVSGTRAYALVDLPREIAVFDIAKPLLPSTLAHANAPAGATSIAFAGNKVLVLADKLYAYTQSLAPAGEFFEPVTTTQQQIEIAGDCAFIIGRAENPERYDAASFLGASPLVEVPSTARSIAVQPRRVYILTEHSIEVWTLDPPVPQKKRRSAG